MSNELVEKKSKGKELGMVPDGWEEKALADITNKKISYGIVQAGPHVAGGIL
ncbi:hypothetical protein GCM10022228_07010 [Halomonas cibimaris]|uniref:Restriction endonuclease subunit S n=1 Tax=Halomonas cibimaris TaxID=657012 RepID=A0ABP7LC94_9GAMM